jgi:transposase
VFCYSGLIFCTATSSQTREDWLTGITEMFHYFDGVIDETWFDNSTPLVKNADKYDPDLAPEFSNDNVPVLLQQSSFACGTAL